MRWLITSALLAVLAVIGVGPVRVARAQVLATTSRERAPRFFLATASRVVPLDVSHTAVLARRVQLELEGATLKEALAEITRRSGLTLTYSDDIVPLENRVHLRAEAITTAAALTDVLFDTGVDVVFKADGSAALVKRGPAEPVAPGSIAGRVTDAKTKTALVGATVAVEGSSRNATTGNDGRYRIADVAPGTYTVRARYIGYAPLTASVTVGADQEGLADFALEKSAQQLNEVVTTGTVVPTEVKALPTPVTVITDSEISLQRPHTLTELIRQMVPTAVSFDYAPYPATSMFSVRGASTLANGGQMKLFIDGIETASRNFGAINPAAIERVEVIRGPQAAAIYGSDASDGVIQVFTKRGDPGLTRPQLDLQAAAGIVQTPYAGYDGVIRQTYSATIRGGAGDAGYMLGVGYTRTPTWVPDQGDAAQSSPNIYGSTHVARGIVAMDIFGRHDQYKSPQLYNPLMAQTGYPTYTKPQYQQSPAWYETIGASFTLTPIRWWKHTVTIGFDRFAYDRHQTQPALSTPGDTLLQVDDEEGIKSSIRYNTSVQGALSRDLSGSVMVGIDHYSFRDNEFYTSGATVIDGSIVTDPAQPVNGIRNLANNTGYFAQAQIGLRDALFLTAGVRAEQNTNFGDSLGTPISPRIGLSYAHPIGETTVKVRGSWGRAIRAPSFGYATGFGTDIRANPVLAPERQKGWDTGLDLVFGRHGSLSLTYYDQLAENLIQLVQIAFVPVQVQQYQNVGRVSNRGVEVEGSLNVGLLQLKAQYGYARARVEQLATGYTGVLAVGDQTLVTPRSTAGASLSFSPRVGPTLAAGITYVGSWRNYDYLALFGCFGGTQPCQPTTRGYIVDYPHFVKVNATLSQQITSMVSGFVSVDNLTNEQVYEAENFEAIMGRITTVGFKFHY